MKFAKLLITSCLLFFSHAVFAQKIMTSGAWEFANESLITDSQGNQRKSTRTTTWCLTKPLLAENVYLDPTFEKGNFILKGGKCALFDEKRTATTATFDMSCVMPRNVKLSMTFKKEATATTYASEMTQTMQNDPRGAEMVNTTAGTFIGACTEGMSKPEIRKR
jgi:hypothetical protein